MDVELACVAGVYDMDSHDVHGHTGDSRDSQGEE